MTKYYRVRTQEQWDWLVSKLNVCRVEPIDYPMIVCHEQGRRNYSLIKYHKGPEPIIEVSQMMEDEKMEDYVTIKGEDLKNVEMFCGNESKGNLREFWDISKVNIPKPLLYPKVPMTEVEKAEFDKLPKGLTIFELLTEIREAFDSISDNGVVYPALKGKLFDFRKTKKTQKAIVLAYLHPELIEVIPEKKWEVKVPCAPDHYYFKDTDNELIVSYASDGTESRKQFTSKELKHYGLDNDLFEKVEVSE